MKLYSYYRSTAAYRVRIALNIKGIKYDQEAIHLVQNGGEQNSAEYRELNPQGLVPTLVDGKNTLAQSMAILEYLEEKQPDPPILPKTQAERAYVRQIAHIIACDIHPINNLRVLNYLTGELGINQPQKTDWYFNWIKQGFESIEKILSESKYKKTFCCGDYATIADICLVAQVYNAKRFDFPMEDYPLITAINDTCMELETFQNAAPENQPDTPEDQRPAFLRGGA